MNISPKGHAPRERVSWNSTIGLIFNALIVTLHVSVWVEIVKLWQKCQVLVVTLHVSVWVEIYKYDASYFNDTVTLHVSVWVEIFVKAIANIILMSRSTWACELKLNGNYVYGRTWEVTLHVSVWVEITAIIDIFKTLLSRSTWACELKYCQYKYYITIKSHAPRERVSWNDKIVNF